MKAIGFTKYGPPEVLKLMDVAKPTPKDDEVLVKVHASSINSWDWEYFSGTSFINRLMFGLFKPKPGKQILGGDIAGTVEAVGSGVTRFQPGDAVFGDLWDSFGSFAEYACTAETSLEPKPENLTFAEAATIPQAGVLAYQGLRKTGAMQPGQKVLINGAGGGVGAFAIQIAKLSDCEVTAVDNEHKQDAMRAWGADHVIDYAQEDYARSGQRYDLILDMQGAGSILACRRSLNPKGVYSMVGGSTLRLIHVLLFGLWGTITGGRKFRLVTEGPNKGLSELKELLEAGKLKPVVDKTFPIDEAVDAFRYFRAGRHTGKIAIRIESADNIQ